MHRSLRLKSHERPHSAAIFSRLYSAILREIGTKGKEARFKKTERGKFALAK